MQAKFNRPTGLMQPLGAIDYGRQRQDGGHDHRTNRGPDRTPAQRRCDGLHNAQGGLA